MSIGDVFARLQSLRIKAIERALDILLVVLFEQRESPAPARLGGYAVRTNASLASDSGGRGEITIGR
jgi:hypothetical protein